MKLMRSKIYITQRDNDRFFNQKLPTYRNGFCYIERNVTLTDDPGEVYPAGEYGFIAVKNAKVFVIKTGNSFEIS